MMDPKKKKKESIGRRVKIYLGRDNFFGSRIEVDGHQLYGVDMLELVASSDWKNPPQLILTLHPDVIEVDGIANIQAFFNMKHDRFSNPDID